MNINTKEVFFDKNRLVSRLFQITVALWFLRMVLPGVKYLLIPSLFVLIAATLWSLKGDLFRKEYVFEFLKTFNPLIFLGVFYGIGLLFSEQYYAKSLSDLFEYGINFLFLIIFFALTYYSKSNEGFFWVFKRMSRVIWVSSVFVALLGLAKFSVQLIGVELAFETPWGTAINADKNFYALYSFLGLIGLYPRLLKEKSFKNTFISNALVLLLMINIILSYSPRSILLLFLLLMAFMAFQIICLLKRNSNFSAKVKKLRFITLFLLLALASIIFSLKTKVLSTEKLYENYFGVDLPNNLNQESVLISNAYQFSKWSYAIDYFIKQSLPEKIFGGGFDYLQDFGQTFYNDKNHIDYPHNPLLSGLLYSGFLGVAFILFFLFVSFYYAVVYFKQHTLFALMLFVCSLFVFFSGNSLFSVPIFLFLFSLSFLIRHQEITDLNIDANLAKPGSKFLKESFDYIGSVIGFILISPLLILIGVFVLFSSGWPVVFSQLRVGQNGKQFRLHKFRTMKNVKSETTVAAAEMQRITKIGAFLRKTKLDELPELWNIIRGDMSFVGTRPDVPGYADKLEGEDRIILKLKPGITGPASLKYINEEELLSQQENPQKYNDQVIWPDKVVINKQYYKNWSFFIDIKILIYTVLNKQLK